DLIECTKLKFDCAFPQQLYSFRYLNLVRAVYEGAVHLEELNILLGRSCQEYWKQRLQSERVERIKQIKEHWDSQCRGIMGV
ncbi:E3 ubiquitin-protein ligase bah1-like protein, partial [Trifolium pratense]